MTKRMMRALAAGLLVCMLAGSAAATDWGDNYDPFVELPPATSEQAEQTEQTDGTTEAQRFSDVAATDWYYSVVMQLVEAGTIDGFPDGTFRPKNTVTTGQALKMILLAAGYPEPARAASHWARGYLDFAIEQGFVTRFKEITDLDVPISRALVAQIAAKAMGLTRPETVEISFTDTDDDNVLALAAAGIVDGYKDGTFLPSKSLTRAELAAITARITNYLAPAIPDSPNSGDTDLDDNTPITLRTTENGVAFIKAREGFRATAYWDYSQYSIGYGSRCEANEYPNGITQEQADRLLRKKLQEFETKLDAFLTKNNLTLNDTQYDALISLTYNIGSTWMNGTRLASYLASGQYTHNELASAMGIWCHVTDKSGTAIHDGLIARRILEIQLFLYGDYSGSSSPSYHYVKFETEQGKVEVDIAFYESGSAFTPYFKASCDTDTFLGWYKADGTELREGDSVTQDMTLTAQWAGQTAGTGESGTGTSGDTEFDWWS